MANQTFTFGGFNVPADCKRIFITAELEPSNGNPCIQPTGFPDLGPVLYPDPAGKDGNICLIESEASMANRLEEVCLADKYTGEIQPALKGLPYIKLTDSGLPDGQLVTASTIDGHRFASEYIMSALGLRSGSAGSLSFSSFAAKARPEEPRVSEASPPEPKPAKRKGKKAEANGDEFVSFVRDYLGMTGTDKCPAANVPNIFVLAMEYDPLSLIHGFQISVKKKLTFVGLRSPRALTASILGLNCERVTVPGVRIDPIGTGDAGQAIFQKQRVTAGEIKARFSIDVGLLTSLRLVAPATQDAGEDETKRIAELQNARSQLVVAVALWKVASFLKQLKVEMSLRTECKLRLKQGVNPKFAADGGQAADFVYDAIAAGALADKKDGEKTQEGLIKKAKFGDGRSPLVLKFEKSRVEERPDTQEKQSDGESSGAVSP
jgi:CRISPR-associated protein Csb1